MTQQTIESDVIDDWFWETLKADWDHYMCSLNEQLFVCSADELHLYETKQITHIVCISNPGNLVSPPRWFKGAFLSLLFGDVVSEADAKECNTKAPSFEDLQQALRFFRQACGRSVSKILIYCDYGASRSPALAYVFAASILEPGSEQHAFNMIMSLRPDAVPNKLVVLLGDRLLDRKGALLLPLVEFYSKIEREINS